MTDQVTQGDAAAGQGQGLQNNMSKLANEWLDQGIKDASAAPTTDLGKIGAITLKGAESAPMGLVHAAEDDWDHKGRTLGFVATSAAMGAVLKAALPESGAVGKYVGLGIGLYFGAKAAIPVVEAYAQGLKGTTQADIDKAGHQVGDAAGGFVLNSAIAAGGYRIGAGAMGKLMATESMDGFAVKKENFWNPKGETAKPGLDVAEPANAVGLASRIKIDGERATLLNSEKAAPTNAKETGDVDPAAPMNVTLYAQTKGSDFLMQRYIDRIASGKQAPLTDAQITDKFGAAPESMAAINKFAADNGLTVVEHNPASGRTVLNGSTGQMMKAFDVKLQEYEHTSGVTFRGRTGTVSVSTDLAPHVKAVLGLDNRPAFRTNYVKGNPAPEAPVPGSTSAAVGPIDAAAKAPIPASDGARALEVEEIMKAYNVPSTVTGEGMTTGFLSLGGTLPVGWEAYLNGKGIDPGTVQIRNAGSTEPTPDPQGANGENALDLFVHKQGLPKATTVMVEAENNDTGMPTGIDRITFPKEGESQITHASVSWGQFEDGWTTQARSLMEDAGKRAALKGVTVTVASGDNGAGDGSPSRKQQVDIPSGLEHFTGAGGTRLVLNADGSYKSEVGWDGMGASGGGRSMFTPRPDFQKGLSMPANLNGSKFDGRGVPDIAANADPRSGVNVLTDDGVQPIGGTSEAAPVTAVQAAAIASASGKPTGYMNPELYKMAKSNPGVFHDITSGRNTDGGIKGYPAGTGWDAETGLGSIDVAKYVAARSAMLNQNSILATTKLVGGFIKDNHTPVNAWAVPYQPGVVQDDKAENK
jgi:kumamolisin